MGLLDLCEEYFGERDIYKLLDLEKTALPKDVKKAYYKLSLQVHPDRVKDDEKAGATEKFKVLSKIYQILSDKQKRDLYDEQGIIEDDEDAAMEGKLNSWLDLWSKIFKPLTVEDISNYQKSYIDSELERTDMKKAYLSGKGCINHMMNEVPFLNIEDEPRMQKIIRSMIDAGEVPEYKIFTEEPTHKRRRRHKKYERESKEAEEIKQKMQEEKSNKNSLEKQIMERHQSRANNFDSFMDKLMEKYGGDDDDVEDDSEVYDIRTMKPRKSKNGSAKKAKASGTPKTNGVKNGRVARKNRK